MKHVAILNTQLNLLNKILNGQKTIESRWYYHRKAPMGVIKKGDTLYFKESGKPVSVITRVAKIKEYHDISEDEARKLWVKYLDPLGLDIINQDVSLFYQNKRHVILIWFDSVKPVQPFNVDRSMFNPYDAWLSAERFKIIS